MASGRYHTTGEVLTTALRLLKDRERLRQAFFAVYDAVFPDDVPTEAEILWGVQHPCGQSISEILDEIERELGLESGGRP